MSSPLRLLPLTLRLERIISSTALPPHPPVAHPSLLRKPQPHHQRTLIPKRKELLIQPITLVIHEFEIELVQHIGHDETHFGVRETVSRQSIYVQMAAENASAEMDFSKIRGDSLLPQTIPRSKRKRLRDLTLVVCESRISTEPALRDEGFRVDEVTGGVVCSVLADVD